jgi:hypothetical protein
MQGIKRDLLSREDGFDPYAWKHAMKLWPEAHQFCHLTEVTKPQKFQFLGKMFEFSTDDHLVIDNSFKFPLLAIQRAAQMAGSKYIRPFTDNDCCIVIHFLRL